FCQRGGWTQLEDLRKHLLTSRCVRPQVSIRRTEASDRCRLKGDGVLRADMDALHLLDKGGDIVYTWPYRYLRRFGRDKATFSFEAGRRCDSGEGNFEFDTKQGNVLFQAVEAAINLQKVAPPHRQTSGGGQASPDTTQSFSLPPPPHLPANVAAPCTGSEADYSLPFDTIAKNVMTDILKSHRTDSGHAGADPLYDSIDEMKIRNTLDHIYDEPEGCAAAAKGQKSTPSTSVYDDPEEMRGDAWRIMGTAADPKGHEYPYNPRVDDYAVPKQGSPVMVYLRQEDVAMSQGSWAVLLTLCAADCL
uniref:Docking protein 2 n=1 Tax=Neolamprologus brichardi TaxID=32507 RepID=A0A3Q4IH44_NEOBR